MEAAKNRMVIRQHIGGGWQNFEIARYDAADLLGIVAEIDRTGRSYGHPTRVVKLTINGKRVETKAERDAKLIDATDGAPMVCGGVSNGY